jgi:predicted AAA+ superfamily ATPase
MFKVKLSKLAELTDAYSYGGNGYEVKISEENGEKYIEVADKSEVNKDRIRELKQLIKEDKEEFQNSVNRYICTLDDMDGIMVDQYLKRLRYHVQELNLWEGKIHE